MFDDFSSLYQVVRPTVLHLMTLYHIPLWGKSDWDQEGMQVLYQLLVEAPRLRYQILRLRVYFNTKFTNHVKDALRKQAPQKRRFNKPCKVDISELAHQLPNRSLILDDYLAWKDRLAQANSQLNPQGQASLTSL